MENDLKRFLAVSLLIHLGIFAAFSVRSKQNIYITMPVEMFFYSTPAQQQAAETAQVIPEKKEKKEELVISKKKPKADKIKKEEKKEQEKPKPQEQTAVQPESAAVPASAGQISIDVKDFPYLYYTTTIRNKTYNNWSWSSDYGRIRALIRFNIKKDGTVEQAVVRQSSGDNMYDQQALRAVLVSSPYPPLPVGFNEDELWVTLEFRM